MVAHCLAALPHEGCGLLIGDPANDVVAEAVGTRNAAASALVYLVEPVDHLRAERAAQAAGAEVIGAFHSHTHTDAWPSSTDVASAVDAAWHWVIVSLRHADALIRSFRISDGSVHEEPISLVAE